INVQIDFLDIVAKAWQDYDSTRPVCSVDNISVLVSTNHVFRVRLQNGDLVVASCRTLVAMSTLSRIIR
ncbi:MAG: hypothetical protein VYA12_05180, partial [Pseudomonadota bacterium]|nr:hypothetical protein [Pseudomonadota bacterium]